MFPMKFTQTGLWARAGKRNVALAPRRRDAAWAAEFLAVAQALL